MQKYLIYFSFFGYVCGCHTQIPKDYVFPCAAPNGLGPQNFIEQSKKMKDSIKAVDNFNPFLGSPAHLTIVHFWKQPNIENTLKSVELSQEYKDLVKFYCEKLFIDLKFFIGVLKTYFLVDHAGDVDYADILNSTLNEKLDEVLHVVKTDTNETLYINLLDSLIAVDPYLLQALNEMKTTEYDEVLEKFTALPEVQDIRTGLREVLKVNFDTFIDFMSLVSMIAWSRE